MAPIGKDGHLIIPASKSLKCKHRMRRDFLYIEEQIVIIVAVILYDRLVVEAPILPFPQQGKEKLRRMISFAFSIAVRGVRLTQ
jgi:hypothetical protein